MPWTIGDVEEHKQGLTARQKRQWVAIANDALQRCLDRGGSRSGCEASAIRQASGAVGNNVGEYKQTERVPQTNRYQAQTRTHQGENHIVVPVVMMVEGVHNGSHGPLLHLGEELGKFPGAWNGIPVVVNHPEEDGIGISANSPDIVDEQVVGRVYNSRYEDGKLRAEAWINESKASQVAPEVLTYISGGRPLDVSVGVFTEDEPTTGAWNEEEYVAIARNHRPDHLALLPGAQGACSWEDGCGVRANRKGGDDYLSDNNVNQGFDPIKAMKEYARRGYFLQTNKQGYQELTGIIQRKLDAMDTDMRIHFLEELYDDSFVYRVSRHDSNESTLYKRGYSVNDDGTVEFADEMTPVTKKVEYVEQQMQMRRMKRTKDNNKGGGAEMTTQNNGDKGQGCCPEKVELLIQSENNSFDEKDREWLSDLNEDQIGKLEAVDQTVETNKQKKEDEPQMNKDEAVKVLKEQFSDPKQFLEILPSEHREQMEHGMKLHQERRQELITYITNNTDVYTEDELKDDKIDALEKLAKAIKPQTDYSAMGGVGDYQQPNDAEILPPPGVTEE